MFTKPTFTAQLPDYFKHPVLILAAIVVVGILGAVIMRGAGSGAPAPALETERSSTVEPKTAGDDEAGPGLTSAPAPRTESPQTRTTEMVAFYANFDQEGYAALERNAAHIDVLMPMWFHLGSDGQLTFDASQATRVNEIIKAKNPDMKVMPIVNNYDKASEAWNAPQVAAMIADPARRVAIAEHIVSTLAGGGYDGMNIDFESFTEADRANLVAFMAELYPRAKAAGLEVSMDVIVMSRTYDHAALAQHVDYLVPMMYDEHWKTSPAGPISSIPWFEQTLARFLQQVPAEKVMVGMGTYAYDWSGPGARAKSLTYAKAVALAQQSATPVILTEPALNSAFTYSDGTSVHSVWMLDAMSAFNQVRIASKYGVRGYAIWRLGAEDPSLWNVLPYRDVLDRQVAESLNSDSRSVEYDEARGLITGAVTGK